MSTKTPINKPQEHIWSNIPWSQLTDFQKQYILLNSHRFLDANVFIQEFQSIEAPEKIIVNNLPPTE